MRELYVNFWYGTKNLEKDFAIYFLRCFHNG